MDHIFGPKKDKLFWTVFVFQGGMSGAICDLVLYLQSEGLNISWIYPGTIPCMYACMLVQFHTCMYACMLVQYMLVQFHACLKMIFTIQYSTLSLTRSQFIFLEYDGSVWDIRGKFRQKRIQLFWAFWSLSFKFFFKRGKYTEHP